MPIGITAPSLNGNVVLLSLIGSIASKLPEQLRQRAAISFFRGYKWPENSQKVCLRRYFEKHRDRSHMSKASFLHRNRNSPEIIFLASLLILSNNDIVGESMARSFSPALWSALEAGPQYGGPGIYPNITKTLIMLICTTTSKQARYMYYILFSFSGGV